jgi:hypothetical protein
MMTLFLVSILLGEKKKDFYINLTALDVGSLPRKPKIIYPLEIDKTLTIFIQVNKNMKAG